MGKYDDWFELEEIIEKDTTEEKKEEIVDGILVEDTPLETEDEMFNRLKEEELKKQKLLAMERAAKIEAAKAIQNDFVVEDESKKKTGRLTAELSDKVAFMKTESTLKKLQDTVDDVVTTGLDSNDIDPEMVTNLRNKEFEKQFKRDWDIQETVLEDIREGRKAKEWQTDEDLLSILDYVVYVFGYNKLTSEVYKERTKNILHNVLMNPRKYANYRHAFRNEGYDAILSLIPKHIKTEYQTPYLIDTFILLHIIYKFGENTYSLDIDDVIDIILANNDHLPATVKYGKPYTREFLLDLSMYHVFTSIQNLCIDEQAIEQVSMLLSMVTERIQQWKDSGEQNTQDMKQAAETLDKLDRINSAHRAKSESKMDSVVFRVPQHGLDYSRFLHIKEYSAGKLKDRKFVYYIVVKSQDSEGLEQFAGWIDINHQLSKSNIKIFDSQTEVSAVYRELENNPDRLPGIKYEVLRLDSAEKNILFRSERTVEEIEDYD